MDWKKLKNRPSKFKEEVSKELDKLFYRYLLLRCLGNENAAIWHLSEHNRKIGFFEQGDKSKKEVLKEIMSEMLYFGAFIERNGLLEEDKSKSENKPKSKEMFG